MAYSVINHRMHDVFTLASQIKALRQKQSLTVAALSARTGIPSRSLTRLEAGDASAPIGRILIVLQALGFDIALVPLTRPTLDQLASNYEEA